MFITVPKGNCGFNPAPRILAFWIRVLQGSRRRRGSICKEEKGREQHCMHYGLHVDSLLLLPYRCKNKPNNICERIGQTRVSLGCSDCHREQLDIFLGAIAHSSVYRGTCQRVESSLFRENVAGSSKNETSQ